MKLTDIKPNPSNPRFIRDERFEKLVKSISEFPAMLELRPIIIDSDNMILAGNMRYRALLELKFKDIPDKWIKSANELTDDEKKRFIVADNISFGENDWNILANEWEEDDLKDWGLDLPVDWDVSDKENGESEESEAHAKLQDKFIIPPFSILDTRQGYWQERKRYLKELIGDNGETRDDIDSKVNATVSNWKNKPYKGGVIRDNSVSILDPVLSEISNLWFGLKNCKTFDPFAGDSVFGYVSDSLGNTFTGIELRKEQVDLNNERLKGSKSKYICDDGQNVLKHIKENSQDLLFSCPPYFNLEVYSDLNNDASNQKEYKDFLKILNNAFTDAIKCLKNNRFAVVTVGDIRDKKGFYYGLIDDIKSIFKQNGMLLYNDFVLLQSTGNAALRAGRYMNNRKVVKLHESVLVFFKGNPKEIKNIYPKLDFSDASENMEYVTVDTDS